MAHYYEKNGNRLPSCTTIIGDCTDGTNWAIPYGANQACDWIRDNCVWEEEPLMMNPLPDDGYYLVTRDDLRRKRKDEKEFPDNARYAHKHHSQKALDIGSEVHNAIKIFLKDKISSVSTGEELVGMMSCDQARHAFIAFLDWENEHNLKPISLEQTVYGDGWAGTLDFYGYFGDRLYVIDWKSSKAHYPEMRYQVAAYRSTFRDWVQDKYTDGTYARSVSEINPVEGCGVLRLDKETGLPEWKDTSKSYEQDLAIFNAMTTLYFLRHPRIAKRAGKL